MQIEVPTCSLESFMEAYWPIRLTDDAISACIRDLQCQPPLLSNGKWVKPGELQVPSAQRPGVEAASPDLVGAIAERLQCPAIDAANISTPIGIECQANGIADRCRMPLNGDRSSHPTARWTFELGSNLRVGPTLYVSTRHNEGNEAAHVSDLLTVPLRRAIHY